MRNGITISDDGFAIIGKGMTNLPAGACRHNSALTCVQVDYGVSYIENAAFDACPNLRSVILPNSLKCIDKNAFLCKSLEHIYIHSYWPDNDVYYTNLFKNVFYGQLHIFYSWEQYFELVLWKIMPTEVRLQFCESNKLWRYFRGCDWVNAILTMAEEAISHCDINSGWSAMNGVDWVKLLQASPRFIQKCDDQNGWSKMSGRNWLDLILLSNSFLKKCDEKQGWANFDGEQWLYIIRNDNGLIDKCNEYLGWQKLDSIQWTELLCYKPEFAIQCMQYGGLEKLDGNELLEIINRTMSTGKHEYIMPLLDRCKDRKSFSGDVLLSFIDKHIDMIDKFVGDNGVSWLVTHKYCDIDSDGEELIDSISTNFLDGDYDNRWVDLLLSHHELTQKCSTWNIWRFFRGSDWATLLIANHQYSKLCTAENGWSKLSGFDWVRILIASNKFSEVCDMFNGWATIDAVRVNGEGRFGDRYIKGLWAKLLINAPVFSKECDKFFGWSSFDGFDWIRLLKKHPEFIPQCNKYKGWDKIHELSAPPGAEHAYDGFDTQLMGKWTEWQYDDVADVGLHLFQGDRYFFELACKSADNRFWVVLLCEFPQWALPIVDEYDIWQRFDATDFCDWLSDNMINLVSRWLGNKFWAALFAHFPNYVEQFISRAKDAGREILFFASLLIYYPEYVALCDKLNLWEKFSQDEWIDLIAKRPIFVSRFEQYRGWESFSADNWSKLLSGNSDFVRDAHDKCHGAFWIALFKYNHNYLTLCDKYNEWNKIGYSKWRDGLLQDFYDRKFDNILKELSGDFWACLISACPNSLVFSRCDECNAWKKLTAHNWEQVLIVYPYVDMVHRFEECGGRVVKINEFMEIEEYDDESEEAPKYLWGSFDEYELNGSRILVKRD